MLAERSIDHVVLERGEVANSWRHERWDSLRLLTPNAQARLPGYRYEGADPSGYMTMADVVAFVARYAEATRRPYARRRLSRPLRPPRMAAIESSRATARSSAAAS